MAPAPTDAGEERGGRILQRHALDATYYSLNGEGWTNCAAKRKWWLEGGEDDDGYYYDDDAVGRNLQAAGASAHVCLAEEGTRGVPFLDAYHECGWFGVSCSGAGGGKLLDVDAYIPIRGISLPSNNLQGELPAEFHDVFKGVTLGMEGNEVEGTTKGDRLGPTAALCRSAPKIATPR